MVLFTKFHILRCLSPLYLTHRHCTVAASSPRLSPAPLPLCSAVARFSASAFSAVTLLLLLQCTDSGWDFCSSSFLFISSQSLCFCVPSLFLWSSLGICLALPSPELCASLEPFPCCCSQSVVLLPLPPQLTLAVDIATNSASPFRRVLCHPALLIFCLAFNPFLSPYLYSPRGG
ncbi:hypothetical protein AHAS_Ahas12G0174400 [Arachis hypogaea]